MSDMLRLQGLDPESEIGRYFDDSKWWWHALWDYVYLKCSALLSKDDYINGHRIEDGYIIDRDTCLEISMILNREIDSGRCASYEKKNTKELEQIPPEYDAVTGREIRPEGLLFPFTVENVKAFADFCEKCGGFVFFKRIR